MPGAVDLSFDSGSAVNGPVQVVVPAGEGKVYAGGYFTTVRGAVRNHIARLKADGTVDETFNPGTGANDTVYSITVQADGKVLIGGNFTSFNGTPRSRTARLNSDGSVDLTFNPGNATNWVVYSLAVQADGKVFIGGGSGNITRLNSNGSLDATFGGVNNTIYSVALQADGKILIGGAFWNYSGIERGGIMRLTGDGSYDWSFNRGTGVSNSVDAIAIQPDGKVLIGGWFTSYNGAARNHIVRLNGDGSLDTSFATGIGPNQRVDSLAVQADGKILIGGVFTSYNGTPSNYIARLNSNGSLDLSFKSGTGAVGQVESIAVQADGKILVGGAFTSYNETASNYIVRLHSDGSLDTGFNAGTGANAGNTPFPAIHSAAVQANGKVLIGGGFTSYNGTARKRIARLESDGSLDTSFDTGTGADGVSYPNFAVDSIAVQPDGKVLIGGGFTSYNGAARKHIARLNSDGSLDTSFDPGTGADGGYYLYNTVYSVVVQADGKVLIGGGFTTYNGTVRGGIARLNSDGSLDTSFDPGGGAGMVRSIALQADGKLLIAGAGIARLNANGSRDTSFNPGTGVSKLPHLATVYSIAVQADGNVLIGGDFDTYNGTARNNIARLNSNGSLDTSFNPGTGAAYIVYSVAMQADGKVLIGGSFYSYNGTARKYFTRLNSDGSLDTGFDPGTGADYTVYSVAMQADGKVLIGGEFSSYNGTARSYLARVENDSAIQSISVPNPSQVQWLRGGAAPEIEQVSFEYSADGASWTGLRAGTRIKGGWEVAGLSLSGTGYIRARGRATGTSLIEQVYGFNDADLDGLLDSWELTYWPTTNGHNANDDFDRDGVPELLELAFGLDPTVPDAALQPLVIVEGGYLTITITKHAGAKYEVQTAGSLLAGQLGSFSAESTTVLINDASTLKVRDNFPVGLGSASRYLRVKVSAAP